MKKIALILTIVMILSMSAAFAQPGEMDAPLLTTYDLVAAADQQLNNAESFEMDMNIVLAMSAEGESVAVNMDANMKFILDPLTMAMTFNAAMPSELDEEIGAEIYLRTEDGAPVLYAEVMGEAVRMSMAGIEDLGAMFAEMFGEMNIDLEEAASNPQDYESLAYIGEGVVNGRQVYVIQAKPSIPVEAMQDIFSAMGMDDIFSAMGMSFSTFFSAYKNMTFIYYIDKATYQYVRMEMDLAGVMRQVMANMGITDDVDVSIDEYSVVMDIKDINKVKQFDVPKRILNNAEDLGDLFGAGSYGVIGGADGPTSIITNDGLYDQIDWAAVLEQDEDALLEYVDAEGNIDYAALAEAYPIAVG